MRALACIIATWAWLAFTPAARAEPLRGVNVAALTVADDRLYVGGFDEGLFVIEPGRPARRVEPRGLSPHINALAWSSEPPALWVGTARGLSRCTRGSELRCRRIGDSRAVHAVLVRSNGEVVAGGDDGMLFVQGEKTRAFGKKQQAPFRAVWALAEAGEALYVGTTSGLFWGRGEDFQAGARLPRASVVQGSLPDDWVTALLARGDELYVGTYSAGVARFHARAGELTAGATNRALGHVNPGGLVTLGGGELAVASMEGLWRGSFSAPVRSRAHQDDTTALAPRPGAEGTYWVGTRRGLEQWSPQQKESEAFVAP
jgi:ligand-binding sensor domain-containing protein